MKDVETIAVVGGGLAGLSVAALLARQGKQVHLYDAGLLGGRATSQVIKGFTFNYGAHAIYGRDQSILRTIIKTLKLEITWLDFSSTKAKYEFAGHLTAAPANAIGLLKTEVIGGTDKLRFTWEVVKTVLHLERGTPDVSIGQWLAQENVEADVSRLMLDLASSNFFTTEPENIPSVVYFDYYRKLFRTRKPVSYIAGGWQVLITELERVLQENEGTIHRKTKITAIEEIEQRYLLRDRKKDEWTADRVIFALPPRDMRKLALPAPIQSFIEPFAYYEPVEVLVYDVGLSPYIQTPFSYVYDRTHQLFVTDLSHYDPSIAPKNGQVLQVVAYLAHQYVGNPDYLAKKVKQIHRLLDQHYPGWRDQLTVERTMKRAIVQEIKWKMGQIALPCFMNEGTGGTITFVGDWCEGEGQLSELSFSSAYTVATAWEQKNAH
ncbi:hypothetical protein BLD48_02615 [Exiguobacterium sp. KRL4]|nr:hypothetical protein BLD48_02615 [Exiguobacterium sp. KRL4]